MTELARDQIISANAAFGAFALNLNAGFAALLVHLSVSSL